MHAYLKANKKSRKRHTNTTLETEISNIGIFVDVPDLGMRGLVPLSSIADDFYDFDSARVQAIGRRSKNIVKLGDTLEVEVDKVDTYKKEVDFRLTSPLGKGASKRRRSPGSGKASPPKKQDKPKRKRPAKKKTFRSNTKKKATGNTGRRAPNRKRTQGQRKGRR